MQKTRSTKLFSAGLIIVLFVLTALPNYSCSQSSAEAATLDGKNFSMITMETGKPETAVLESVEFSNGNFDNKDCHIWGFGPGKYTATKKGDHYEFEAVTTSATEGEMAWKGKVHDDIIEGTMVWRKPGQADMNYSFANNDIKLTSLDGKTYNISFKSGDETTSETIHFANGIFESPGCYQWGFTASPYRAFEYNGNIHWQSLYESANEGKMLFVCTVDGEKVNGYQAWVKAGQENIYYDINGMEVK